MKLEGKMVSYTVSCNVWLFKMSTKCMEFFSHFIALKHDMNETNYETKYLLQEPKTVTSINAKECFDVLRLTLIQ